MVAWAFIDSKKKKMEFGVLLQHYISQYPVSIVMGFVLVLAFAEGAWAAGIESKDEGIPINPVVRNVGHISLQLLSVLCALVFVKDWKVFWKTFAGPYDLSLPSKILFRGLSLFLMGFGTFYLPWWNTMLIANALHETLELEIYWASFIPWPLGYSKFEYANLLLSKGLPINYNAFGELSYAMAAQAVMLKAHILLICVEAIWSYDAVKSKAPPPAAAATTTPPANATAPPAGNPPNNTGFESYMREQLAFYGMDQADIDNRWLQIKTTTANLSATDLANLIRPFASITTRITANKAMADGAPKIADREAIVKDIKDQFAKSPRNQGLGITLPAPKP
jgi:hypothetical protein